MCIRFGHWGLVHVYYIQYIYYASLALSLFVVRPHPHSRTFLKPFPVLLNGWVQFEDSSCFFFSPQSSSVPHFVLFLILCCFRRNTSGSPSRTCYWLCRQPVYARAAQWQVETCRLSGRQLRPRSTALCLVYGKRSSDQRPRLTSLHQLQPLRFLARVCTCACFLSTLWSVEKLSLSWTPLKTSSHRFTTGQSSFQSSMLNLCIEPCGFLRSCCVIQQI